MEERPDPSALPEGIPDVCYEKSRYPHVLGSFLFCFKDAAHCYHCGASDCPSECCWGITDVEGKPKKA